MARLSTPIPPDKIGENFAWRDWFQRLSDKVYGSIASQDASAINITGGTINGTSIGATTASTGRFTTLSLTVPSIKTTDFTVAATEVWLINNKSGSTCTVTLPTASSYSGRILFFQNYQVQTVVSATSNVVSITGGAAGTSILLASSGDQCTLVSNGTSWLMTQYISNNNLLLE
jgi:hypothetical protein